MPKIRKLVLEISNPCNEHCVHCYRTCDSVKQGFLSLDDVKRIFGEIASVREKQLNVTITGGEPLLNKNWREILSYSIACRSKTSLFTNASTMTEDDVEFLASFRENPLFREVQISLYSLQPEIHDAVTGLKGSCLKTLNAIKKLKKAGVSISVSCPVMKINKDTVPNLMRYMDQNGIGSCADLAIFPSSDYEFENKEQTLFRNDLEAFFEETSKNNFELGYVWRTAYSRDNIFDSLFYEAAAYGIVVSGDGSIYPMTGWYEKMGNIHEDSILDIFLNHPLLKKCRKIRIGDFKECRCCSAIEYCSFYPTTHLTANQGQLMKLNKDYCDYVHLIKMMAERRDREIAKNKSFNKI